MLIEGTLLHEFSEAMLLCPVLAPAMLLLVIAAVGIIKELIDPSE